MNFYSFDFENQTFKCRIRTRDHAELGKLLGESLLAILGDEKRAMDVFSYLPALLYVALKPFEKENGKFEFDDTCALIDRMVDAGWSIEQFIQMVTGIGEASGFFPKGAMANAQAAMEAAQGGLLPAT